MPAPSYEVGWSPIVAAFGFICGTRAGFRLEGSRRFKCGLGPFGVSGLFNCRRFFSFVALGLFSCSFAVFFVLLLWLSHFVTFVLGQSVRVWTWFQVVLRVADCFIHLLGCISLRVSIGVLLNLNGVCRISNLKGRQWCVFVLCVDDLEYIACFIVLRIDFGVGVASSAFHIIIANICLLFVVCRCIFGVGVVGEECAVEKRFNFVIVPKGNLLG